MSNPESDAARVRGMTVELALEIADLGNNALYRRGWYDPAHARELALNVLAEEVRRLRDRPCFCYGHEIGCQSPHGGRCTCV